MTLNSLTTTVLYLVISITNLHAQTITFENKLFELCNVKASVVHWKGQSVLKVERDLEKLPFDSNRLETTVDEATFVKLKGLINFENGVIEVKMLSQLQDPSPFALAQGFIWFGVQN